MSRRRIPHRSEGKARRSHSHEFIKGKQVRERATAVPLQSDSKFDTLDCLSRPSVPTSGRRAYLCNEPKLSGSLIGESSHRIHNLNRVTIQSSPNSVKSNSLSPHRRPRLNCCASSHSPCSCTATSSPCNPEEMNCGSNGNSLPNEKGLPGLFDQSAIEGSLVVSVGGRSTAQEVGNYRMLVDDLSYFCSAVAHCRFNLQDDREHTPITAGAACDIAELISHSDARAMVLRNSAQASKSSYGKDICARGDAFNAVLESIACAPPVVDSSAICHGLIDCRKWLCPVEPLTRTRSSEKRPYSASLDPLRHSTNDVLKKIAVRDKEGVKERPATKGRVQLGLLGKSGKYDTISWKALSIVSFFVGIDCTGSDRAAVTPRSPSHRVVVEFTRKSLLQHKAALKGIARLVANDPVVLAHFEDLINSSEDVGIAAGGVLDSVEWLPPHNIKAGVTTIRDPTKLGRKSRKKRNENATSSLHAFSPHQKLKVMTSLGHRPRTHWSSRQSKLLNQRRKCQDNQVNVEFLSEGLHTTPLDELTESSRGDKYGEKLSLALSRARLTNLKESGIILPQCERCTDCPICSVWNPLMMSVINSRNEVCGSISASSLAILAAECVVTCRDKFSTGFNVDMHFDENSFLRGNDAHNPILQGVVPDETVFFANEMLRLSGSLPLYSRSMSETLLAILLLSKPTVERDAGCITCSNCTNYLQCRASTLSEVIDSLCCLSPNVSIALSVDELFLVPSLLRLIAELVFSSTDNDMISCESVSTALKTLTSLSHENSDACDQIIRSYCWEIPLPASSSRSTHKTQVTGVDILFSYLFKVVTFSNAVGNSTHKSNYDNTIFCLNIMTNISEMVPYKMKTLLEHTTLNEMTICPESNASFSGLSWLAKWVVSKTLGFQESVMNGSFGLEGEVRVDVAANDLDPGEVDNLVASGNGFVLLACLMMDDGTSLLKNIRDIIVKELPVDSEGSSGGIQFMIRTLKAFCNFYHYSVGDLSVAVIAPVVKLIAGLQSLHDQEHVQVVCKRS
mmetsp:Transcript_37276/g.78612  ORF Transcript_37276/g.78612 Transcript_37276/m.78612 type:complete len:1022 (+) Transcript_37276:132-3197(+)